MNEIYSLEQSEGIDNSEDIENTIEMNEHISVDDLGNQMSTEESADAEGAAQVYNHWMDFSGSNFSEELDLPYADEETFEMIKMAYEQVDFLGEFEQGNQEVYDTYRKKYKELLENDGLIFDTETGTRVPFSQIDDIEYYIENYGLQKFVYNFFDIDGDELPELSVHMYGNIYVLDYDSEKDVYSVWYHMTGGWYSIIGTKKVLWQGNGKYLAFYLLEESGKEEYETFFMISIVKI